MESTPSDEDIKGSTSKPANVSVEDLLPSEYTTLITSKTVNLIVGPKRKSYPVHKDLLCRLSEYFNKAFNGAFQEAQQDEIYLEGENPAAIELFIGWLYRGVDALRATQDGLATLLELYLTADKWCLQALQSAVIDSTQKWFERHPDKGLKALASLAKRYYHLLDKMPRCRYSGLMLYYAVQLCLTKKGDYEDFLRVLRSNRSFAHDIAARQMLLLRAGKYGQKWLNEFRNSCFPVHS
ncbi:hypothetical protein MMC27_004716 [Xylographa pallens]|nr:hypothetical protein [Xylographa pallens]